MGQLALCFVLLIGTGLCLRSFAALYTTNPGFNVKNLLVVPLELKGHTEESSGPFYQDLTNLLYGTSPTDPLTFAVVPMLLTLIAFVACFLPAYRAAQVNPIVALRQE